MLIDLYAGSVNQTTENSGTVMVSMTLRGMRALLTSIPTHGTTMGLQGQGISWTNKIIGAGSWLGVST